MDLRYVNMDKFGFIFRNGPTNVRKAGKGVQVPCGAPIIRLGGGWGVTDYLMILGDKISLSLSKTNSP